MPYNPPMLRWTLRAVSALLALIVIGAGGVWLYLFVILTRDLPVPDLTVEPTPARLERGEYLATAVYGCIYCHSERDWSLLT